MGQDSTVEKSRVASQGRCNTEGAQSALFRRLQSQLRMLSLRYVHVRVEILIGLVFIKFKNFFVTFQYAHNMLGTLDGKLRAYVACLEDLAIWFLAFTLLFKFYDFYVGDQIRGFGVILC